MNIRSTTISNRIWKVFPFLVMLFALNHSIMAQTTKINLSLKNVTIKQFISAVEEKTDYTFMLDNTIDQNQRITVDSKQEEIGSVLKKAFGNKKISYEIAGKQIILKPKTETNQNPKQITGIVRDEMGEPVIGANVKVEGSSIGTITDLDGQYSLNIPEGSVLIITYLGYTPQTVKAGANMNIKLEVDNKLLDEVVVIGYGTVKRVNLGGAVATTDSKVFESRPIQNAASALQGEVPGLTIIRTSGAPGSTPDIRIRDVSSLNGGSPLVLIDGAEGDLGMINPADIENISVLKDGTAAIYGARAADGVILITTKNAKRNQKLKIMFDTYYSVSKPSLLRRPANLYQHAAMALEITDGSFPIEYTADELQLIVQGSDNVLPASNWGRWTGYPKFYKDQDWNKMIIGNGNQQNYNLNLSGGGETYTYLISLGHQNENGLPKFGEDNNKRYFIRAKSNIQIVKNVDYDVNVSYEASDRNYSSGISEGQNIWELIYKTRSWAPLRNPAGRFYTFEGFDNPAQVLEEGGNSNQTTANFTFNNQLRWKIIDGLNLIGRAVIRKNDFDKNVVQKMLYSYNWDDVNHRTARKPNSAERRYSKTLSKNFTLYAEYKKTLNDLHDIGVMVGAANESADYDEFWAKRINFDQQEIMSLPLGSTENQEALSKGHAWTINSYFSRLNYSFANKYLIEATLRADGSSRYHPDHRWGYFPGVSVAWRLGEESFMKNLHVFDDLKLRTSYGEMGNQLGNSYYDYIELITAEKDDNLNVLYYPFGNNQKNPMYITKNLTSTARTWETVSTTNFGIDFGALQNKLYGSFDYFRKENKNMLIMKSYPKMLGIDPSTTNDGRLQVNGWEIALGWRDRIGELNYSVKGSLSDAKTKMMERSGDQLIKHGLNQSPKGYPLNSYFGYEFDGIIQNEQELADYKTHFPNGGIPGDLTVGDAKYKDLDNDGKLSVLGDGSEGKGDVKYLGDANPRYTFGLNLNAEYKGFDLGAFFQGVGQRTMFLEGETSKPFSQPWFQSAEYWYGKTWTPERTDAKYPAITLKGKRNYNYEVSSNTKHNVAYLRLKNLQIGYSIPKAIVAKWGFEKIRIYLSGEDLFEFHNAPGGWDPEEISKINYQMPGQYSITSYPFARNYSLGANIVF